jgi:hypothetical protein
MGENGSRLAAFCGGIVGGAAAVAALWLAFGPAPVARASSAPPVQHKIVSIDFEAYKELPEFKEAEKSLGSTFAAVLHMQEVALNNLGAEGWELVQMDAKQTSKAIFYLKRAGGPDGPSMGAGGGR